VTSPFEQMRQLRAVVEKIAKELGLEMTQFNFVPVDSEGSTDIINAMFIITPDAVKTQADRKADEINETFESLLSAAMVEDDAGNLVAREEPPDPEPSPEEVQRQQRFEEARQRVVKWNERRNAAQPAPDPPPDDEVQDS
jgi:capsular polysaccharide biosynthesis protein